MNIGQVAAASGVSAKMIRHYEDIGLTREPARTDGNYRAYTENDVHVLRFIKRARRLGFGVQDIKQLLGLWQNKSRSSAAVKKIAGRHVEALKRKITELQSMSDTLEHLARHCHGDHRPDCPILEDLAKD
jgi:MerR family gold-responsive transcriptional activator of gol and ges genes